MPFDAYYPKEGRLRSSLPKVNRDRWNPRTPLDTPQHAFSDPTLSTTHDHLAACRLDVLRLEDALLARGVEPLGQNGHRMTFQEGYKKGFDVGRKEGIRINQKEQGEKEIEQWGREVSSNQFDDKPVENREGCVTIEVWKLKAIVLFFCLVVLPTFIWCL